MNIRKRYIDDIIDIYYIMAQIDLRKNSQEIQYVGRLKSILGKFDSDRRWYLWKGRQGDVWDFGINGTSYHYFVLSGDTPAITKERIAVQIFNAGKRDKFREI